MNIPKPSRLDEPYVTALEEAVDFIRHALRPTGIIVCGSVISGTPDPTSDLDFAVIHTNPWRQRLQRRFNGVSAEIFVNSRGRLSRAFADEVASARPIMLHMIATGRIVFDPASTMGELQEMAQGMLDVGPSPAAEPLILARSMIATAFEDAEGIRRRDPERAMAILILIMLDAARLRFRLDNNWIPREKVLLSELGVVHPDLARLIRQVIADGPADARFAAAKQVVMSVTGATGFFSWDSQPLPD